MKAPGVHVFAGFNRMKVIFARKYKTMNGAVAARILKNTITPALKLANPHRVRFLLQMDGAPEFRTHVFQAAMKACGMSKFGIPPRSGDLAPIETMWAQVVKDLNKIVMKSRRWKNGAKNNKANRAAWAKLVMKTVRKRPAQTLLALSRSMAKRVAAVIANRGGPTRW